MKERKNNYMKGFTLVEVLVALILTSIAITFSFSTLSYIQRIFSSYKDQNKFINEYSRLKNVVEAEVLNSDLIVMKSPNEFSICRDSIITDILLGEKNLLLRRGFFCDTFHFVPANISVRFEPMSNLAWMNRLVKSLSFDFWYNKQGFSFYLEKSYDASVKMKLNTMR
jgi:prepilin-type N-terminal cleavage/methylation domain-containing protein